MPSIVVLNTKSTNITEPNKGCESINLFIYFIIIKIYLAIHDTYSQ